MPIVSHPASPYPNSFSLLLSIYHTLHSMTKILPASAASSPTCNWKTFSEKKLLTMYGALLLQLRSLSIPSLSFLPSIVFFVSFLFSPYWLPLISILRVAIFLSTAFYFAQFRPPLFSSPIFFSYLLLDRSPCRVSRGSERNVGFLLHGGSQMCVSLLISYVHAAGFISQRSVEDNIICPV